MITRTQWSSKKTSLLTVLFSVLGGSPYYAGITDVFLADDWGIILLSRQTASISLLSQISTPIGGWYRPVFLWFIRGMDLSFGLEATLFHTTTILLYITTATLVGFLALRFTEDPRIAVLSSFLFALHPVHSEPVLWIASSNEIVALLAALITTIYLVQFLTSRKPIYALLTTTALLLALASKETAVFLALLPVILFYSHRDTLKHSRSIVIGFLAIGLLFVVFRLMTGSPYHGQIDILRIPLNAAYYAAVLIAGLPDNYGYASSLPLLKSAPIFPLAVVSLSLASVLLSAFLIIRNRSRIDPRLVRFIGLSLSWSIASLLPVILTATGRTAMMASVGICWGLATALIIVLDIQHPNWRSLGYAAIVALSLSYATTATYRTHWWRHAAGVTTTTIETIENKLTASDEGSSMCIVGLPDHFRYAYAFRNAFPSLPQLLFPERKIVATIMDGDAILSESPAAKCDADSVFVYRNGQLEPLDSY